MSFYKGIAWALVSVVAVSWVGGCSGNSMSTGSAIAGLPDGSAGRGDGSVGSDASVAPDVAEAGSDSAPDAGTGLCLPSCETNCSSDTDCNTAAGQVCCDYGSGGKVCQAAASCPRICSTDANCNTAQ